MHDPARDTARDPAHDSEAALTALEDAVRRELDITAYPRPEWLTAQEFAGRPVRDVLIVGGGQGGLTAAFALRRRAITNVEIVDTAPAGKEGPWVTYARMHTLRTPKGLTGPDQGLPSLTPESWYRARFGDTAWNDLVHIDRHHWQEYLGWYRRVTDARVRNETTVTSITPAALEPGAPLAVQLDTPDGPETVFARRVVLATGLAGNGAWTAPAFIREALPEGRYNHTGEELDFSAFAGKRLGVLGGGASAFDYAASALEAGAASVDLFYRRAEIPRVNPFRWMEFYAFGAHFPDLPDADKWRYTVRFNQTNQPPPQPTWYRCMRHETFTPHTGSPWTSIGLGADDRIRVTTPEASFEFDHVIAATGPTVDLAARPELAELAPRVALWRHRFTPPAEWQDASLLDYPYLGSGFEFVAREPGRASWVTRVSDFTYGARLSMGLNGNMNSGLGAGGRRLADALSRSLFLEDREAFFDSYRAFDVRELVDLGRPADAALPEVD
ncbi:FAD-dependent urate hydroxylase HpyO [Herbiconiux moechotypicola]|uniref:FAD-dependent urate hydroxylase HpyO n=1 Tax=Herbiconiux moechotypicola TaxID=637393 RepID=A0ABN3DKV4_9MICO